MPELKKMSKTKGKQMPHAGQLVYKIMLEKRISKSELARMLDIHPVGIARYIKQNTLHAALLWKIGQVLEHNFFLDLAKEFPLQTATPEEATLQLQITDLQKELAVYQKILSAK